MQRKFRPRSRGDERCRADETSRKGKGKGNGGMGEHGSKGGAGSKGRQQVENSVMDEDQGNTGVMRSEEEEENHREDVRKSVEMMQKEEDAQEEQRGRVAPNMGAGGSHPQAMSVPERKEIQGTRWAEGETWGRKKGERQTRQCNANTLHLVIYVPTTTTPTTTAAAAMRLE